MSTPFVPLLVTAVEWAPDFATGDQKVRLRCGDVVIRMSPDQFFDAAYALTGTPLPAPSKPPAPAVPDRLEAFRRLADFTHQRLVVAIPWGGGTPRLLFAAKDGRLEAQLEWP